MTLPNFTTQNPTVYKTAIDATASDHETRISQNETDISSLDTGKLDASRFPNVDANVPTTDEELEGLNGLTASRAIVTDGSGILDVSTTTATELLILNGATLSTAELNYADGPNAASKFLLLDSNAKVPFAQRSSFRGALVAKTSDQAISTATNTAITWNSEIYDTDSIHDLATNTSRLTVPSGVSRVRVNCGVLWYTVSGGFRKIQIRKNGSQVTGSPQQSLSIDTLSIDPYMSASSAILEVSPTDYFEVFVYQNSGGSINIAGTASSTWFSMEIID